MWPCPRGSRSFDAIEGNRYRRETIRVHRPDGSVVTALTYVVKEPQEGLRTSLEYLRHIVTGLREQGAAEDYIREVKRIAVGSSRCGAEPARDFRRSVSARIAG